MFLYQLRFYPLLAIVHHLCLTPNDNNKKIFKLQRELHNEEKSIWFISILIAFFSIPMHNLTLLFLLPFFTHRTFERQKKTATIMINKTLIDHYLMIDACIYQVRIVDNYSRRFFFLVDYSFRDYRLPSFFKVGRKTTNEVMHWSDSAWQAVNRTV